MSATKRGHEERNDLTRKIGVEDLDASYTA
jgi:hypothetical protein